MSVDVGEGRARVHPIAWAWRGVRSLARPHGWGLLAGVAHSALIVAAFDPFNVWAAVFVAPLALVLLSRAHDRGRAAVWAAVGALPMWGWFSWWMWDVSAVGFVPLVVHQALYTALIVWLLGGVRAHLRWVGMSVAVPVVWTGVEVLRGTVLWDGYPWYLLGHPLIDADPLQMPAALGGAYLVSFLVAAWSGLVVDGLRRPRVRGIVSQQVAVGLAVVGVWVWGALRETPAEVGVARVAAVQTDVPTSNKLRWTIEQRVHDFARFAELTLQVPRGSADMVVWPETMFPGDTLDPESVAIERAEDLYWPYRDPDGQTWRIPSTAIVDELLTLQQQVGVAMVVGDAGYEGFNIHKDEQGRGVYGADHIYNSVFVLDRGRVTAQRYDKLVLTPFGEVMPGISSFPWLERALLAVAAHGMTFDLSPGRSPTVLEVPRDNGGVWRVATPICFEVTAPRVCRSLVYDAQGERQADLIVNLSNDGWFGRSDMGRMHHLRTARWRCVELATGMVRSVNTGVSAAIDARGRVTAMLEPRTDGVLLAEVGVCEAGTPYGQVGDAFGWACLWGTLGAGVFVLLLDLRRADSNG